MALAKLKFNSSFVIFNQIKWLIRDYWCLQTPVSMYVTSQSHDITSSRHDNCNSLRFSPRKFWIAENRPVDHIGVLQIPTRVFLSLVT